MSSSETAVISFDNPIANMHLAAGYLSGHIFDFLISSCNSSSTEWKVLEALYRWTSTVHLFKFVIDANGDNSSIKVLMLLVIYVYNEAQVGSDGAATQGMVLL